MNGLDLIRNPATVFNAIPRRSPRPEHCVCDLGITGMSPEMEWSQANIPLEKILELIKGFLDILVLASGFQSSGQSAAWDVANLKRALQWGLFFEDVCKRLSGSADLEELDASLKELASTSLVPQGLANLSSVTLSRGGDLALKHLLQRQSLSPAYLLSLLRAVIEMDISRIGTLGNDSIDDYVGRLMVQIESLEIESRKDPRHNDDCATSNLDALDCQTRECAGTERSCFIIRELVKRRDLISGVSSIKKAMDTLLKIVAGIEDMVSFGTAPSAGLPYADICPENNVRLIELSVWSKWRSRCLSYLLDNRTMRLLSGAQLIFSAPKVQWVRGFEPLKVSASDNDDNLLDILILDNLHPRSRHCVKSGLISNRWSSMLQHFQSYSCSSLPMYQQYSDIRSLLQGNSLSTHLQQQVMSSKEKELLEYMALLLGNHPQKLWQLSLILVAAAIPSWSTLFKMHWCEIEKQLSGTSATRCCSCSQMGKEHLDCEVAHRIWCLHIFHIRGSLSKDGDLPSNKQR